MSKMVIEVPDQFVEVGKAMAEQLAMLQRTADRLEVGGRRWIMQRWKRRSRKGRPGRS